MVEKNPGRTGAGIVIQVQMMVTVGEVRRRRAVQVGMGRRRRTSGGGVT
jgi:hypothetical protein